MLLCLFLRRLCGWQITVADTLAHLPCPCLLCPGHQDSFKTIFFANHVKTFVVYVTTRWDPVAYAYVADAWKVPADSHEGCLTPSKVGWSKDRPCLC